MDITASLNVGELHTTPWPGMVIENIHTTNASDDWLTVCESRNSRSLLEKAARIARAANPVLITGECGTGKRQLTKYLHARTSQREHPIIQISCAKLVSDLSSGQMASLRTWYSLLNEHRANAHVTWILERVDEIPLAEQSLLSQFVDEILRVSVRRAHPFLISTANPDIFQAMEEGRFRKDLFYKLNVLEMDIPALRDRKSDIPPLLRHFLAAIQSDEAAPTEFTSQAIELLCDYDWPGNVVQLRNVISQICVLVDQRVIDSEQISMHWQSQRSNRNVMSRLNLEEAETHLILQAVARCDGNKTAAARQLGISTRTLQNKMQKYRQLGFVA